MSANSFNKKSHLVHPYLPMTMQDQEEMLEAIGKTDVAELFAVIPEEIRLQEAPELPEALTEIALRRKMKELAAGNQSMEDLACFLGAGTYDHAVTSAAQSLLSRGEFVTAYTPYQAEMSQGELQATFEFQSYICELTAMEVANASMYDGATALAEACRIASGHAVNPVWVVSAALHPESLEVLETFAAAADARIVEVASGIEGVVLPMALQAAVAAHSEAAVVFAVQSPNFFGAVEPLELWREAATAVDAALAVSANPLTLAVVKPPGAYDADFAVGDMQALGISPHYGGPGCGYFAANKKWMRKMPGRMVSEARDNEGRRGYVLTLQTREQHIRREKATSNICSNQSLLALAAAMHLSVLGKTGYRQTALRSMQLARYALEQLLQVPGVERLDNAPFVYEFAIRLPEGVSAAVWHDDLLTRGILGGLVVTAQWHHSQAGSAIANHQPVAGGLGKMTMGDSRKASVGGSAKQSMGDQGDVVLLAVTELRTKYEIDQLAASLRTVISKEAIDDEA